MRPEFSRAALLLGAEAMAKLRKSRVAVFGVGGVGGSAVEALARCGIGALDQIDSDRVSVSNINRQVIALHSTVGQLKVDAAAARVRRHLSRDRGAPPRLLLPAGKRGRI